MPTYVIELLDSELLPHKGGENHSVIKLTEYFAEHLYADIQTKLKNYNLPINKLKQIVFGFAATKSAKAELIKAINGLLVKQYTEVEIVQLVDLLKELKSKKSELIKLTNDKNDLMTIEEWEGIMSKDFNFTLDLFTGEIKKEQKTVTMELSPALIKRKIGQFYFGSNQAMETMSRVFYDQWLTIKYENKQILPKRNTLLLGSSGSGKTYLVKKMAEFFELPFLSYDVTKMSRTGYVGDKVEDILSMLYNKAGSIEKMKNGIVFLDESDKLAANLQYGSAGISTTGVQLDLLKFIEGENYKFNTLGHRENSSKETTHEFDSSNLLIICGGAFEGIDKFIERRKKKNTFGFIGNNSKEAFDSEFISTEDLIEYGLIKEFAARFQIIITLTERTAEDLHDILVNAEDSVLKNYKEYFKIHDCELFFDDEALREISKYAFEQKAGARSLIKILEKVLPMYSVGNKEFSKFTLTKEIVINNLSKS